MIKKIIFDLDGTLYDKSNKLFKVMSNLIFEWIKNSLKLSVPETEKLLDDLERRYPAYNQRFESLGLSIKGYHQEVFAKLNPKNFLSSNEWLVNFLKQITVSKDIATLASESYAQKVLDLLGIKNLFDNIYSSYTFGWDKKETYLFILKKEGLLPQECLVVGDDEDVDLEPAKELGMNILLVNSKEDLFSLKSYFLGK